MPQSGHSRPFDVTAPAPWYNPEMSDKPKRLEDLTPYEREIHETIDLGPYTWKGAVVAALFTAMVAFWAWWRYAR